MRRFGWVAAAAVVAAIIGFVLLAPQSGIDTYPPQCTSYFGYVVPCGLSPEQEHGAGFAFAGAIVAAVLVVTGWAVGRAQGGRDGA
jgi:hypothetical protein